MADPLDEWWESPWRWLRLAAGWIYIGFLIHLGWAVAGWLLN